VTDKDTFVEAVQRCADLPDDVREAAKRLSSVEAHSFDQSYIDFLDTQIRLSPRGPAWTERLKKRREGLLRFRDRTLLRSSLHIGVDDYTVEVDPAAASVVYWERYEDVRNGT
jgi:hypothetical protein